MKSAITGTIAILASFSISAEVISVYYNTVTKKIVAPTNILGFTFNGSSISNLAGYGLIVSNEVLMVDTNVITSGGGGGSGTVTSVGLALPSQFSVSGTPVTGAGTLTSAWVNQVANRVFVGPTTGADAAPTFRGIVDNDIPNNITIDLAATATVANSGDSATAFFTSGEIEDARLPAGLARDSEVAATYAPLASPALTGSPTVPTATAVSSNNIVANTEYVDRAVTAAVHPDPYEYFSEWEEQIWTFEGDTTAAALEPGLVSTAIASGTVATTVTISGRAGLAIISAASAALNTGAYSRARITSQYLTEKPTQMKMEFYLPSTNGCRLRMGLQDSVTTSDPTDGIYLAITNSTVLGIAISNTVRAQTPSSYELRPNVVYESDKRQTNNFVLFTLRTNNVVVWSDSVSDRVPLGLARVTGISVGGIGTATNTTNAGQIVVLDSMMFRRQK